MVENESPSYSSSPSPNFNLPEDLLTLLPSDPFQQLDIARKITSLALSTRVSKLETESTLLQAEIQEKDELISNLQSQIQSLDSSLSLTTDKLVQIEQEKEMLLKENESLANAVRKLNRDVSKLEVFKKTLMQSLQEDEESILPKRLHQEVSKTTKQMETSGSVSSGSIHGDDDTTLPPSKSSSMRSQFSETESSFHEEASSVEIETPRYRTSQGPVLASYNSTPKLTPPGSPPILSASVSPRRISKPASPRRHSMSFSSSRGVLEDRASVFSSLPPTYQSSISSSPYETGSQSGRTRVDGKEFFRQVRSRLSYEQFGAFLANVKELNSQKQTREETLRKADEIFGPGNKDLYVIFEGLITRNVPHV